MIDLQATPGVRRVVGIFGKAGSGKSLALRSLVLRWPRPCIIVDVLHELERRPGDALLRPGRTSHLWGIVNAAAHWAWRRGNCCLVVDELDAVVRPGGLIPPALKDLMAYGRHPSVDVVYAVRRPPDVPVRVTAQATDLLFFAADAPQDLDYFKQRGVLPDVLRGLPPHGFVHQSQGSALHIHTSPWATCEGV